MSCSLYLRMFVRKKKNKSGVISVQIIDKSNGKYRVIKTIGSSNDFSIIANLELEAKDWLSNRKGLQELDFTDYHQHTISVLDGIEELTSVGIELVLGKIFNEIGFDKIKDEMFRLLVLARLSNPVSKLKTTDYLYKYHGIEIDVQVIYRYLDKLHKSQKDIVQRISYEHTLKILDNTINIVFYDVTTVYFEIEREDDIRKTGFSKEGKHQNPQIVIGLLVAKHGYPLAYDIFEGNKFEGHTMIPIIKAFKEKYTLEKFLVVADAGLLSNDNIKELEANNFEYILGARIKNESADIKEKILDLKLKNGESKIIRNEKNQNNIIINYALKRAKKDAINRERGIEKLNKQIKSGKLTKKHINNRGYNKFLEIKNKVSIELNTTKIEQDARWDGLKGYITNAQLPAEEIIENYNHLWQIEKAFRVTKTDLKIRPIYHRVQNRIEAHICIVFVAFKIYKELERQLKLKECPLSPEKVIDIAKTIMAIKVKHPVTKKYFTKTLLIKNEQVELAHLFDF